MNLNAMIQGATQTLIDHVDELTALDQAIGDGDHGLNMRRGALAIQGKLEALSVQTLNEALRTMGMTCMSTIGGSSGPVFGTLLVTLSKELPPRLALPIWGARCGQASPHSPAWARRKSVRRPCSMCLTRWPRCWSQAATISLLA